MRRKRGRSLLGLLAFWIAIFVGGLSAGEMDPGTTYTVRKGDTLWHISGTFLQDPRLWPKIWEKNRYIKNPNLIYPGDPITIPGVGGAAGPIAKESAAPPEGAAVSEELPSPPEAVEGAPSQPEGAAPSAVQVEKPPAIVGEKEGAKVETPTAELLPYPPAPVVTEQNVADSGFIGRPEIVREQRRITKALEEKNVDLATGDGVIVNVGSLHNVMVGDRFSILRPTTKVRHPVSGRVLGILVLNIGWLEIKEVLDSCSKAEIAYCYLPAVVGDRLGPYQVPAFPMDLNAKPTTVEASGFVVAARDPKVALGARDIVYIDLGSKQNIVPGDMFFISRLIVLPKDSGRCKPRTTIGELVVLRAQEETSSAFILNSNRAVLQGDQVFLDKKMP